MLLLRQRLYRQLFIQLLQVGANVCIVRDFIEKPFDVLAIIIGIDATRMRFDGLLSISHAILFRMAEFIPWLFGDSLRTEICWLSLTLCQVPVTGKYLHRVVAVIECA